MLIDKEVLLKDLEETVVFSGREGHVSAEMRGANKVISRIKAAPAVTLDDLRPKGQWVMEYVKDGVAIMCHCSECEAKECITKNLIPLFCWNCGAKMTTLTKEK